MAKTLCYFCMREGVENGVCTLCGKRPTRYDPQAGELALPPGTRLDDGNIILGERLGSGGFGITYVALDRRLGRIALKEFAPRYMLVGREGKNLVVRSDMRAAYDKSLHSFLKESRLLVELRHPNIVRVFFEMDENGTGYYGMELLEGEDLGQYVRRRGMLNPAEAYRLLEPIMDALIYMHSTGTNGTFHRDISPDNIYLRRDGTPCLIDFGAASTTIQGFSVSHPNVRKNGYSPLEQNWDGSEQGAHTDIYSLAATIYYVLSGNPPAPSNDRMDSVSRRGGTGLTLLSQLNPNVNQRLEKVIEKGLALLPENRYKVMREFKEAMREAIFTKPEGIKIPVEKAPGTDKPGQVEKAPETTASVQSATGGGQIPAIEETKQEAPRRPGGYLAALALDFAVFLGLFAIIGVALGKPAPLIGAGAALMVLVNMICCATGGGTLFQRILGCGAPKAGIIGSFVYNVLRLILPLSLIDEIAALIRKKSSLLERLCGMEPPSEPARIPRPAPAAQPAPPPSSAPQPQPQPPRKLRFLRCVEGVYKDRRFVLDQEHCLGRDKRFTTITFPPECVRVSSRHCVLHPSEDSWRVEDLHATNGTYINDQRLPAGGQSEPLKKNDRLRVGDEVFVYEED